VDWVNEKMEAETFDSFDLMRVFKAPHFKRQPADYGDDSVSIVLE
jgi:hypothetical protein